MVLTGCHHRAVLISDGRLRGLSRAEGQKRSHERIKKGNEGTGSIVPEMLTEEVNRVADLSGLVPVSIPCTLRPYVPHLLG